MQRVTADRLVRTLQEFAFDVSALSPEFFLKPDQVVRLGEPPVRIEILTTIDGVSFRQCYARAVQAIVGDVAVRFIALPDLKTNKRAAGRH